MLNKIAVSNPQNQSPSLKASPEEERILNQALNPAGKAYLNSARAFREKQSFLTVIDYGKVTRVLPQDNQGSEHQLFFVRTDSGALVKVAHNISVCEPVPHLKPGMRLGIKGEFIHIDDLKAGNYPRHFKFLPLEGIFKNEQMAGLIHYTHRDLHGNGKDPGGIAVLQKGEHYGQVIT